MSNHACGGAMAAAEMDGDPYRYCVQCNAFAFLDHPFMFPDGTDVSRNLEAWDAGRIASPDAERVIGPEPMPMVEEVTAPSDPVARLEHEADRAVAFVSSPEIRKSLRAAIDACAEDREP